MHISPHDPTGSFRLWSRAHTAQAVRPQDWTPEDVLFHDYHRHAEAMGVVASDRLDRDGFRAEMRILSGRMPEPRRVTTIGASFPRMADCWPRTLRATAARRAA